MRWEKVAFVMFLGLSFSAQAQNNVVIDLSVLDGLSSSYVAPTEPMFPVLPKQKAKSVQKTQKPVFAARTQKKKTKPVTAIQPKEDFYSEEEKIVVVDVEPTEPFLEVHEVVDEIAEPKPQVIEVHEGTDENTEPTPQVLEVHAVIDETTEQKPQIIEEVQAPVFSETAKAEPLQEETDQIKKEEPFVEETKTYSDVQQLESAAEKQDKPVEDSRASTAENVVENSENVVSTKEPEKIVIPQKPQDKEIVFEEGVSELTPEQISQIDEIVGHFDNSVGNKVAIYSYNVEGGANSFRKKRISLNRAIEIRSYLLRQGFKNFSIKVININEDSDKANTVELEEI